MHDEQEEKRLQFMPYHNIMLLHVHPDTSIPKSSEFKQWLQELFPPTLDTTANPLVLIVHPSLRVSSRQSNYFLEQLLSAHDYLPLASTYTNNISKHRLYDALMHVEVIEELINNKPKTSLTSLEKLVMYFEERDDTVSLKTLLKNLLIKELNPDTKTIRYFTREETIKEITKMKENLFGEIKIEQRIEMLNSENPKRKAYIVLHPIKIESEYQLKEIIRELKKIDNICEDIGHELTQSYTMTHLRQIHIGKLHELFIKYSEKNTNKFSTYLRQLGNKMFVKSILIHLYHYGVQLVEEETRLRVEFEQYVIEMTHKYTSEAGRYLAVVVQLMRYGQLSAKKMKSDVCRNKINNYLKTAVIVHEYNCKQTEIMIEDCGRIQIIIQAYLTRTRQCNQVQASYYAAKHEIETHYTSAYKHLLEAQNEIELRKFINKDNHSYRLSCVMTLLEIRSLSIHYEFRPKKLEELFSCVNESGKSIVKIVCEDQLITVGTIDGRQWKLGTEGANEGDRVIKRNYENNIHSESLQNGQEKENQQPNYHHSRCSIQSSLLENSRYTFYDSIVSSRQSPSLCSSTVSSQLSSHRSLPKLHNKPRQCIPSKTKKHKIYISHDGESIFKITADGKLFAKGSNDQGQLGIVDELDTVSMFIRVLMDHLIRFVASNNYHTVCVTTDDQVYYFGCAKGTLLRSRKPVKYTFNSNEKLIIEDLICSSNNSYLLCEGGRVFSLNENRIIKAQRGLIHKLPHHRLVTTGGPNLELTYLISFHTEILDKVKFKQIQQYLSNNTVKPIQIHEKDEELLMDNDMNNEVYKETSEKFNKKSYRRLEELSRIIEQEDCFE